MDRIETQRSPKFHPDTRTSPYQVYAIRSILIVVGLYGATLLLQGFTIDQPLYTITGRRVCLADSFLQNWHCHQEGSGSER